MELSGEEKEAWAQLMKLTHESAALQYKQRQAVIHFAKTSPNVAAAIEIGLKGDPLEISTAFGLLREIGPSRWFEFLPLLLDNSLTTRWQKISRDFILGIPRGLVLPSIEAVAEPIVQRAEYFDIQSLQNTYSQLDGAMADRLKERVLKIDPNLQELFDD